MHVYSYISTQNEIYIYIRVGITNMDNSKTEYILFTSESVGEGHPGDVDI